MQVPAESRNDLGREEIELLLRLVSRLDDDRVEPGSAAEDVNVSIQSSAAEPRASQEPRPRDS